MGRSIQFWFDFASTYSYLSAMRIEQVAAQKGVSVIWQPFLLGPIFAAQGWDNSPFNIYPAKGRYMWRDMERLCAQRNLALVRPDPFPQNSLRAARLMLAVNDHAHRAALARSVFCAEFAEGRDISADTVLTTCLTTADLPVDLLAETHNPDIKTALFGQTELARTKGVFGAPSFVAGDELFWGDDRLDDAVAHAGRI